MAGTAQGTSVVGKQLLGTIVDNSRYVFVSLRSGGGTLPLYKGYVSLELVRSPYNAQAQYRKLYGNACFFDNFGPFLLNTQIVVYWAKAGILWRADWQE